MARVGGIFVCLLIVIMDVAAGILGFEAETAQKKVCMLEANYFYSCSHCEIFYVKLQCE